MLPWQVVAVWRISDQPIASLMIDLLHRLAATTARGSASVPHISNIILSVRYAVMLLLMCIT
jgi:hypothetical protein